MDHPYQLSLIQQLLIAECGCNQKGSDSMQCNEIGKCQCKSNFDDEKCDRCADLSYGFPNCKGKESKILLFKLYMHVPI